MEVSIINQFIVTLLSAALGVFLGALYDIIRIWRTFLGISYINKFTDKIKEIKLPLIKNPESKEKKENKLAQNIVLTITDIIYFFVVTLIMIIFVYHVNDGIVRWYIFVASMLGLLIYYFTIGKIVISVSEYITFFIRVALSYIAFFISRPFAPIFKKIKLIFQKIRKNIKEKKQTKSINKSEKSRREFIRIGKS